MTKTLAAIIAAGILAINAPEANAQHHHVTDELDDEETTKVLEQLSIHEELKQLYEDVGYEFLGLENQSPDDRSKTISGLAKILPESYVMLFLLNKSFNPAELYSVH
ncbi:hypothetical protein J4457_04240 [Candidatus Woesearchaeota archaeon]|nr:hypothetical protein [Candidatus Woesearchaeota archaeon]